MTFAVYGYISPHYQPNKQVTSTLNENLTVTVYNGIKTSVFWGLPGLALGKL